MLRGRAPADPDRDQPFSPAETRHALLTALIAWGIFGSTWAAMVSGAPFVTFARNKLGASTFMFGLLSALPFAAVLAQLPGSYWVERHRMRRRLFVLTGSCSRLIWFAVAALPWVVPARLGGLRVGALLALVVLGSTFGHAGTPAWFSWFADMVPERIRARYLGNRAALATTTAVIVSTTVAWIVDHNSSFAAFTIIFGVAALFGLADVELFWTVREPPMPPREGPPWRLRDVMLGPLGSRPFRGYLLYALSEAFMFGIAGPFFWLMSLEFLKIGNFWSNVYVAMVPMIFTALALPAWGGLCDRFGSKPLVTLGTLMSIVYPVCWALATPGQHHVLLATAAVIGGLFGGAIQIGDMNMLFSLTPRENRSAYIAMLAFASSLGWCLAPTLSGALAQALRPVHLHLAGLTFGNLHFLMLISIVARILHVLLVIPHLPEANPRRTRDLLRHLVTSPLRRVPRSFWTASTRK
jgi:MFS family permease